MPIRSAFTLGVVTLTLLGCAKNAGEPTAPQGMTLQIDTTIIPADSMIGVGGAGFYAKFVAWQGPFNPLLGDSALDTLLEADLAVTEFWYPQEPSLCVDPLAHEREIARLEPPDSSILRFGYAPLDSGYADCCIPIWRRYRVCRIAENP